MTVSHRIADRLQHIESSPTLALAAKAKALAGAGKPVADFTAGEPDAPTPEHIKQAAVTALQDNRTRYTPVAGIPPLRDAVAELVNRAYGCRYAPDQVLVSCGAKHSLYNIFQALCQPGDDVVICAPYWVSYPPMVHLAGARPVIVPTREADGFLPDPEALRAAITGATRALILNSPSNPTGAVIDRVRLEAITALAASRGVAIVSDEIYDQLVYAPARHASVLEVAREHADQVLWVGGVSKTFSMTGWRIGYAVGPKPWIAAMSKIQSHATSNPTSISQYAALAALTGDQAPVHRMREAFQRRRDLLVGGLNRLPGLRCAMPDGAFYAWCNVEGLGQPAARTAEQWIDEALVVVVPGEGFGAPGYVRFSFATSETTITEGLTRLGSWLATRGRGAATP